MTKPKPGTYVVSYEVPVAVVVKVHDDGITEVVGVHVEDEHAEVALDHGYPVVHTWPYLEAVKGDAADALYKTAEDEPWPPWTIGWP